MFSHTTSILKKRLMKNVNWVQWAQSQQKLARSVLDRYFLSIQVFESFTSMSIRNIFCLTEKIDVLLIN